MTIDDAFAAATSVFSMFDAYFNSVVQGVGKEKAFALLSESLGNAGAASGKIAKEQMGIEELDVKTTSSFIKGMYESLGVSIEIEEEPTKVLFKNGRRPVYVGLKGVGYSDQDVEAFCREGPAVMMN